jgi:hypothetical protein
MLLLLLEKLTSTNITEKLINQTINAPKSLYSNKQISITASPVAQKAETASKQKQKNLE